MLGEAPFEAKERTPFADDRSGKSETSSRLIRGGGVSTYSRDNHLAQHIAHFEGPQITAVFAHRAVVTNEIEVIRRNNVWPHREAPGFWHVQQVKLLTA